MTKDIDLNSMNYYELEPENNSFYDIVVDITHRCNMECKNCYVPNRFIPDMRLAEYTKFVAKLPKPVMLRIVGAEPTLHPELTEFIRIGFEHGHNCILITNGLRLASQPFVDKVEATGLKHVYMSLNGIDNDDWYEQIDEMRCATKKIKAFINCKDKFNMNAGIILVKGINEEAPRAAFDLITREKVPDITLRFKNVGQLGRYQKDADENLKMADMVKLCADQLGFTEDYIWSHYGKPHRYSNVEFPLDPNNKERYKGQWVKITDWDTDNEVGIPDPGSVRRGRVTKDWKVAPFYEHVKMNEGEY